MSEGKKKKKHKGKRQKAKVPVHGSESTAVATVATRTTIPYYVIIGRGISAWYNHLTMLQTEQGRARLGNLPVVHIGFKDPWHFRGHERMGQWPRMLNFFAGIRSQGGGDLGLPGHLTDNTSDHSKTWLDSHEFARSIERVETDIRGQYLRVWDAAHPMTELQVLQHLRNNPGPGSLLRIRDGFVGAIETKETGDGHDTPLDRAEIRRRRNIQDYSKDWLEESCPYRLAVFHRVEGRTTFEFIYAKAIDVCTGVSSARRPKFMKKGPDDPTEVKSAAVQRNCEVSFASEDCDPQTIRDMRPKICDGNTYIGSRNYANEVVAVIKSGAVAAQSVQSALEMPTLNNRARSVWWISTKYFSKQKALHERLTASETVPGARNQLEIAGACPNDELVPNRELDRNPLLGAGAGVISERALQQEELAKNFNVNANPAFRAFADSNTRTTRLSKKLHNLAHHELKDVTTETNRFKIELRPTIPRGTNENDERAVADALAASTPQATAGMDRVVRYSGFTGDFGAARGGVEFSRSIEMNNRIEYRDVGNGNRWVQSMLVDRLVFSSGQDYSREGAPSGLLRYVGPFETEYHPPEEWNREQAYPVAFRNSTGTIRVLGGAMVVAGEPVVSDAATFDEKHANHFKTLPAEAPAAAGGGINPALINIRRANGFQYQKVKINSASKWELVDHGLSVTTAIAVIAIRQVSVRGHTVPEYRANLEEDVARMRETARKHRGVDYEAVLDLVGTQESNQSLSERLSTVTRTYFVGKRTELDDPKIDAKIQYYQKMSVAARVMLDSKPNITTLDQWGEQLASKANRLEVIAKKIEPDLEKINEDRFQF